MNAPQKDNKIPGIWKLIFLFSQIHSLAKAELTKYQLQATNRWGFDFSLDKPIKKNNDFEWESVKVNDMPKIYHVINVNSRVQHHPSVFESTKTSNQIDIEYFNSCNNNENICPLVDIKKPILVKKIGQRSHQTKITGKFITSFEYFKHES